mmetsp:Transcript_69538/g.122981  ORF Transcript_69538/g.122981 Transcript_69538/m.122981 type:complete len:918 (+) Transcript_69538:70-2823(+)|eukprot:CAMPEP_0197653114 /NCGR_PEP_ID=MMETSP1338-20131121/34856_1 /TAXON_ID=43686 ORGANISM="Pelagodinium beii, Strain RCC1491" /NCGR_SAMPLE_ID=MMETSP1338 /ASSEMBLY_ACC=CAM_ASM_000754 /LENGTH=917 /DNA_ID=CAMNT_0043228123 /DNA_START=69 /DNA_END=2822 /DNA_ORIENTATION=+
MRCASCVFFFFLRTSVAFSSKIVPSGHVNLSLQSPEAEAKVKDEVDKLRKDVDNTLSKAKHLKDAKDAYKKDYEEIRATFFGNWSPSITLLLEAFLVITVGFVWLAVFFACLYKDDRQNRWDNHESGFGFSSQQHGGDNCGDGKLTTVPDVVIVFHHPDMVIGDEDKVLSKSQLQRLHMMSAGEVKAEKSDAQKGKKLRQSVTNLLSGVMKGKKEEQTRGAMRKAILQNLCSELPSMGFDTSVFRSVDDDEIFVCLSLRRMDVINHLLVKNDVQLPMSAKVVRKLGIKQPEDDPASAPPRLTYSPQLVENLHKEGIIRKNSPDHLYEDMVHGAHKGGRQEVVLNSAGRIRLIFKELNSHLNVEAAVEQGLLVGFYPAHQPLLLEKLAAACRQPLRMTQPCSALEHYFGSRLAFILAWNGAYTKALAALAPLAICIKFLNVIMALLGIEFGVARQGLGFAVVVTAWGRIAFNIWSREQAFFSTLWDVNSEEEAPRADFQGELTPSILDHNVQELTDNSRVGKFWQFLSHFSAISLTVLVGFAIITWERVFEGSMSIVSELILSVQIVVFSAIFDSLMPIFLSWENHKWQSAYYNSYLWKQFLFQCVNRYAVFLYLMVRKEKSGCGDTDGCLINLQSQLKTTLLVLSLVEIAKAMAATAKVKFLLWLEHWQMVRAGNEPRKRTYVEEQAKYATFQLREQVETMVQLVMALGFVLLFGSIEPLAVPLCFLVFYVQLRASGYLLCHWAQRPLPRGMNGVGNWDVAMQALMHLGVVTTAFLIIAYGGTFRNAAVLGKLAAFCLICLTMWTVWLTVDWLWPPSDGMADLLAKRRHYVKQKIMAWGHPQSSAPAATVTDTADEDSCLIFGPRLEEAIQNGDWAAIPRGDGSGAQKPKKEDEESGEVSSPRAGFLRRAFGGGSPH